MRTMRLFLILNMFFWNYFSADLLAMTSSNTNNSSKGIIEAINIENRTIQINKKLYALADKLQVYDKDFVLINQNLLMPQQKVTYWITEQPLLEEQKRANITETISKIHVLTELKEIINK